MTKLREGLHPYVIIPIALLLQGINLLRSYPRVQNCGRRVQVSEHLQAFINCDSSVFLKDAANPSRLVDGSSVYQDRLLFTLLAVGISWFVPLAIPDRLIEVTGNSGENFL